MKPVKPIEPSRPYSFQFEERVERVYIYEFTQGLREDYETEEEEFEEKKADGYFYDEDSDAWIKPDKPLEEVNLGWLMTQIPEGIKPSDIKIDCGYRASSMAYENHHVKFYYEITIPAKPKEFEALMGKYHEEMDVYNEKIKEWEKACRQQEIKETELKLKKLKGI